MSVHTDIDSRSCCSALLGESQSVTSLIQSVSVIFHYEQRMGRHSAIDLAACSVKAGLQKQDTAAVRQETGRVHLTHRKYVLAVDRSSSGHGAGRQCDIYSSPRDQFRCEFHSAACFDMIGSKVHSYAQERGGRFGASWMMHLG